MAAENPIDFSKYISGEEALKTAARSVRSLKNDVSALSKSVDDDAGRIKAGFERIAAAIKELQGNGGKLSLTTDADKKLLQDYIKQVGDLKRAKEDLKATEKAQADLQRGLSDATRQYTTELAKQKDALRAAALAGDEAGQRKAAAAIRQTTLETTQLSKALRGANSEFTAARGSYDALTIENNKLLASLHALEGGLLGGSQEALKLKKQIYDNTETLKLFDLETNRSFRNVGNYAQSFQGLIAELAKARTAQAGYAEGSAQAAQGQMRIAGFQTAAQKSAAQMGLSYEQAEAKINGATAAIQPLVNNLVRLEKEQERVAVSAGKDSDAYRRIGFEIESTRQKIETLPPPIAETSQGFGDLANQLSFTREGLTQFAAGLVAGAIGLQAILSGVQAVFQANVVLSDSLADVRKTTGLTADETDRLVDSLKGLDTRTSLAGLLDIAKVGGQLGIAKGDILEFTKAVDVANQALGDDFGGGAEEIATELGKIAGVFRKELGPDVASNLLAIGSAVNELGAAGAATAPFLADVALRTGAVSAQTGVGLKNILAYAAVLQETGFSAETSGTALNRFFSVLSTRTEAAFRIAQKANPALTLKEFTKLVNTDFNQAIQVFLKGLNAGGKTTTELSALLTTLKLQSGEAKNVIITLAKNTELFAERQKTANDQLRDATSLAAEAAIKNDTLAGSTNKLGNSISNFFTSGAGGRFLKFFVDLGRTNVDDIAKDFGNLGKAIDYVKDKFSGAERPQKDFAAGLATTAQGLEKQASAQQNLLNSYTELSSTTNRTEGQRLELAKLRNQLITQFGTDEAEVIQAGINKQLQAAESYKQALRTDLAAYDKSTTELLGKAAAFQDALSQQEQGLSAQQIAQVEKVAKARAEAERRSGQPFKLDGKSLNPELEAAIATNVKLLKTEQDLAAQQRTRTNILNALGKLQPAVTKGTQDASDAAADAADSEEELDRAAKARSDNRRQRLQGELADNQRRIEGVKEYQAAQGKAYADGQISQDLFQEAAAGSQDLITQLERNGTALRIRLIREETAGKLVEVENERIRLSGKKNVTQAELTDIEGQAAAKRVGLAQNEVREIERVRREGRAKLENEPIEFIAPLDTKSLQKELDKAGKAIKRSIDNSENQVDKAGKTYETALEKEVRAKQVAENKKRFLQQQTFELANTLAGAYATYQQGQIEAQAAAEDVQYQTALKNAGENQELREKIEEEHQKKLAQIKRRQAEADRNQALFTVALNTAEAVTSVLSTGGGTRYADFGISAGVLTAIVIAQGLAQSAAILARPIPQFFKGARNLAADVPLASVSERGPEIIHRKQENRLEYVAKPSFTSLGRGDSVYTASETAAIMQRAYADQQQLQQPMRVGATLAGATAAIQAGRVEQGPKREMQELHKAIQSIPAAIKGMKNLTVNVHGEGATASIRQGSSLVQSMNQRLGNYGG